MTRPRPERSTTVPRREKAPAPEPRPQAPNPAPTAPSRALRLPLLCVALVAATWLVFGGVLSSDFVSYDDGIYVTDNATVKQGLTAKSLGWAFTATEAANWHPLTWLSHMLDVQVFGAEAGGHHATSLLLHTLNAILILLLLRSLTGALWRSALVAFLFALHPLHVESVAWVAERKDVLSTLLWLLTFAAWLRYARSGRPSWYALSVLLFALGLMAKPMLVTLPFTLLLLDYWPLGRLSLPLARSPLPLRYLFKEKLPFFALTIASSTVTFLTQRAGGAVHSLQGITIPGRLVHATWTYAAYLWKTVWPSGLAVFYPMPAQGHPVWQAALTALVLLGVTVMVWRLRKVAPYLAFGWLWYAGTLVPVIGLVQVGSQMMADRYTYVPLIGIFVALAWGLGGLAGNRGTLQFLLTGALCVWLAVLSIASHAQVARWADSTALFEHALAVTDENCVVHNNLGTVLADRGAYEAAMAHFREALRITPNFSDAHGNMAVALEKVGRRSEAVAYFHRATQLGSKSPAVWVNRGNALAAEGRLEDALGHYERALGLRPDFVDAVHNKGLTLERLGRREEAAECFIRAGELDPGFADAHYQAGRVLANLGRTGEAEEHFRRALRLKPRWPEAHDDLGAMLAVLGRYDEAVSHYREALRLKPEDADAHNNLGLALASMGHMPEAAAEFRLSIKFRPGFPDAHNNLGAALAREGRAEEAAEEFRAALRLRPGFPDARENLRRMEGTIPGNPNP